MPITISLNASNVVAGSTNSVYSYRFPNSAVFSKGDKVALQSLSIYYSWYNITSVYNNNSFSYNWTVGVVTTVYPVVLPNGFFTISNINSYFQSVMFANGTYLINASGNFVYYSEIVANSVVNAFQINSYPVPTVLPAGYSQPANFAGYPAVPSTPQFIIPSTSIQTLLGFTQGSYPPAIQSTAYSALSQTTPQISPITSVYMFCNLVRNNLSRPNSILYNFSANTTFGSQIQIVPPYLISIPIQQGTYPEVRVSFVDQNYNAIAIGDPNVSILLAISTADDR